MMDPLQESPERHDESETLDQAMREFLALGEVRKRLLKRIMELAGEA